jgi:YD repeat-containing protein
VARTFSYGYDDAGRVTSVTDETAAKTTSYAYYDNGRLHTITDGDGETVHFDYGPWGPWGQTPLKRTGG